MSISLNQGFANDTLDHCLEDLTVRFVVNCPEEDLSSYERVLFQIEEANWFYLDYVTTLNPLLQPKKMKQFTRSIVKLCPVVWKWGDPEIALASFGKYKSTIPVRGCALINQNMDKVLLVKGIESNSWGFPRGKISKDEKDVDCAIRELDEETGFDASDSIDDDLYVERTLKGKNYKIYIIKNVPDETEFNPKAKFEIVDIKWHSLKKLSKSIKTNSGNFFLVNSMLKPIMSHINSWKNSDVDHLKLVATTQLKNLLGIGIEKKESIDPGRELLSFIQNAASKRSDIPKSEGTTATEVTTNTDLSLNTQITPISFPPLPQLPLPPIPFMSPFFPPIGFGGFPFNMPPPPPHAMFNNNGSVAHAPSASSLSKPNIRSKVSNSKELLSILTSKVLAPKSSSLSNASFSMNGNPMLGPNINNGPIKILKRGDGPQNSNASQLMNLLKRPPPSPVVALSPIESSIPLTLGNRSDSPISTKTELPTSSRGSSTNVKNDPSLLNRPQSSDSSSQLLNLLKKPTTPTNQVGRNDSNELLGLLKKSNAPPVSAPVSSFNDSNEQLDILKKPNTVSPVVQTAPVLVNESNQLLNTLKKPTTQPIQTSPSDSNQLLNILKKPNGPPSTSSSNQGSSRQQITILKKQNTENVPTNGSNQLLNILKNPATPSPVSQPNESAQLLNMLKKPPVALPPLVSSTPSHTENGSNQLLNILKKPSSKTPTSMSASISNGSNQLLNILKKPLTPENIEQLKPIESTVPQSKSNGNQLLNILKNPSGGGQSNDAMSESHQEALVNNESNENVSYSDDEEDEEEFDDSQNNTDDFNDNEEYEDFEEEDDGVNIGLYHSDSD